MAASLADTSSLLSLFAEPTRVRLFSLLVGEELSVAELTQITQLAQSRVSTHLGKLREAGLLTDRRQGSSTFYRASASMPDAAREIWALLEARLTDPVLDVDRERCEALLRSRDAMWPDAVAGQMERYYSPGRTWEATARGLIGLSRLGDVLDAGSGDGTMAALIAPLAKSVICLDRSEKVLEAARTRLRGHRNVGFALGDLLEPPFDEGTFDHVMLFNVLTMVHEPSRALAGTARVLRPGGRLALVTLAAHDHAAAAESYGHFVPGFEPKELARLLREAGLTVERCEVTSRERRKPYFEIITAFATKG